MANNVNNYYTNCNISKPILRPELQLVSFNGFAWSNAMGMIHETIEVSNKSSDQWLGTQQ